MSTELRKEGELMNVDSKNIIKNPMLSPFEINDDLITFEREEFETIINSVPDGILIADSHGWVLFVNKGFELITGIEASRIRGNNVKTNVKSGLYSESVVEDVILTLKKASKMVVINTKDMLVTGIPILDRKGELDKIVCTIRDLTDLNKMKESLEKSKAMNKDYKRQIEELKTNNTISKRLIGSSAELESVIFTIKKVADLDVTILITGESGTGKGVVAELIHLLSRRNGQGRYIYINCGAIPEQLMESELFGYEKGAFTGARKEGKQGLIELAHNGTIFLDEIGELPMNLQVKLLHVLQNKVVMRVGGTQSFTPNVRFIAANNKNLEELSKKGLFRYDLFYRLNVVPIQIPPLRNRKTDILTLSQHFLNKYIEKYGVKKSFTPEVMDCLESYDWPGNVRELENIVERLVIMSKGKLVTKEDLPQKIKEMDSHSYSNRHFNKSLKEALYDTERNVIKRTINSVKTLSEAADILGIDMSTLTRKKKKYNIYKRNKLI